jgi:hypothetical protein
MSYLCIGRRISFTTYFRERCKAKVAWHVWRKRSAFSMQVLLPGNPHHVYRRIRRAARSYSMLCVHENTHHTSGWGMG